MSSITSYSWPGNVRELEHVIARAVILCESDELVDLQLLDERESDSNPAIANVVEFIAIQDAEKRAIVAAMGRFGGDKSKAAKRIGISCTALYDKITRHNLND